MAASFEDGFMKLPFWAQTTEGLPDACFGFCGMLVIASERPFALIQQGPLLK